MSRLLFQHIIQAVAEDALRLNAKVAQIHSFSSSCGRGQFGMDAYLVRCHAVTLMLNVNRFDWGWS